MLEISVFTVVILVLIFHIILANLLNWGLRESNGDNFGLALCLIYILILAITFFYLKSII